MFKYLFIAIWAVLAVIWTIIEMIWIYVVCAIQFLWDFKFPRKVWSETHSSSYYSYYRYKDNTIWDTISRRVAHPLAGLGTSYL